jgi:hypothetical protein
VVVEDEVDDVAGRRPAEIDGGAGVHAASFVGVVPSVVPKFTRRLVR